MDDDKLVEMRRSFVPLREKPSSPEVTRRTVLILLGGLAAAALAAGCGSASSDTLTGVPLTTTADGSYPLDLSAVQYAALQEVGGAVMVVVGGRRLIIARTAVDTYTAYTATCTHEGCSLPLPSASGIITCPCHGSRFDLSGKVLKGPARRNLAQVAVSVEGETLKITP